MLSSAILIVERLAEFQAVVFAAACLTPSERRRMAERARARATEGGVPLARWLRWRQGREVGSDLLMIADPAGEADRIKNFDNNRAEKAAG